MTDTKTKPGLLAAGWTRVRQSHKVLWWVYVVNLVLGLFSAFALALRLSGLLNHSLAASRLTKGMDMGVLVELLSLPEALSTGALHGSLVASVLFFLFMLFALGGILQSFARQRHLVPGEFFQAAGAFFWRLVRLLLWTLVSFIPVGILYALLSGIASRIAANSAHAALEFYLRFAVYLVVWLVMIVVRLCFDVAQVKLIVEDRHRVTRTLRAAIGLTRAHLGTLFWMYFRINLIGWVGSVIIFWCWLKGVAPEMTLFSFILGQLLALLWIVVRLWQRASEVVWFQRIQLAAVPVDMAAPEPLAVPEPLLQEAPANVAEYVPPADPPAGQ